MQPFLDVLEADEVSADPRDLTRVEIDGMTPTVLLRPGSVEGLRAAMRTARERGTALVPVGSGSRLGATNTPARYDAALSLQRLNRILDCDPDNSYVRVQAGCPLSTLEAALAARGQCVPLDFPSESARTTGGLVSLPFVGPRFPFSWAPRDVVLGLRVTLADGRLVGAGGVTAKNVAGYDLTRLFVGSCGSLCVVTEVNLRTVPLPEETRAVEIRFADRATAFEFAGQMAGCNVRPSFAAVVCGAALDGIGDPDGVGTRVLVGAEGFGKDVAAQLARARDAASAAGAVTITDVFTAYRDLLDAMNGADAGDPDRLVVRVSAPMSDLHQFSGLDGGASAIAFVPAGVIVIRASAAQAESVLAKIDAISEDSSAHRHVVSAPIGLKRSIDVWRGRRQSEGLMRAIKSAFDPTGVLSPGRMPGLL